MAKVKDAIERGEFMATWRSMDGRNYSSAQDAQEANERIKEIWKRSKELYKTPTPMTYDELKDQQQTDRTSL